MRAKFFAAVFPCIGVIFSPCATPLQAKETVAAPAFTPSSPWHLDAADERCRLAREFGEDYAKHVLFMELDKPSRAVDFAIGGPATEKLNWRKPMALRFGSLEPIELEQFSKGAIGEYEPAVLTTATSLAPADKEKPDEGSEEETFVDNIGGLATIPAERFAGNETLHLVQGDWAVLSLKVPNLVPALNALNQCADNLVEFWGLDLDQHRTMQRGPVWKNSRKIIRKFIADYPSDALRSGEQGVVRFLLIVDDKGEVTECRQSDATELEKLDSPACKLMKKAEFDPALDANGKPMRSYFSNKVRYVLR